MLAYVPHDPQFAIRSMLAPNAQWPLCRVYMLAYVPNDPIYYEVYAGIFAQWPLY